MLFLTASFAALMRVEVRTLGSFAILVDVVSTLVAGANDGKSDATCVATYCLFVSFAA
jgi:hypothetical protein